jgi:N-dimethylarginine dimethylaminohydrolase
MRDPSLVWSKLMDKNVGSQSMVTPLLRVVVKRPEEAFRDEQSIAQQWKQLNYTARPDLHRAAMEHQAFVSLLKKAGVEVLFLPAHADTGLDSLYTHDPALVTSSGVILFQTGKVARRGEARAMEEAFREWGIPVLGFVDGAATAEGGDMVWLDQQTLIAGKGFRTNAAGIDALRRLLEPLAVRIIAVDLPYWNGPEECLHLMSFISMLDDDLAVVYKRLLPVALFEILEQRGVQMIEISEEEYLSQACNVLAVRPRELLMIRGNPVTRNRLEAAGCTVQEFSGEEICWKGSGGPTCLTRPIYRATNR